MGPLPPILCSPGVTLSIDISAVPPGKVPERAGTVRLRWEKCFLATFVPGLPLSVVGVSEGCLGEKHTVVCHCEMNQVSKST